MRKPDQPSYQLEKGQRLRIKDGFIAYAISGSHEDPSGQEVYFGQNDGNGPIFDSFPSAIVVVEEADATMQWDKGSQSKKGILIMDETDGSSWLIPHEMIVEDLFSPLN